MHPLSSFFIINELSLFMMNELALLECLIFFQLIFKKIWRMILWSKLCSRWVAHWGWLIGSTPQVNSAFWIGCLKICDDFFTKNWTPYTNLLLISECSVGSFMSSHSIRPLASLFTLVLWPSLVFGANGGCIWQLRGPAFLQKALSNPSIVFCFYCALSSSAKQIVLFLMLNTRGAFMLHIMSTLLLSEPRRLPIKILWFCTKLSGLRAKAVCFDENKQILERIREFFKISGYFCQEAKN